MSTPKTTSTPRRTPVNEGVAQEPVEVQQARLEVLGQNYCMLVEEEGDKVRAQIAAVGLDLFGFSLEHVRFNMTCSITALANHFAKNRLSDLSH